MNITAKLLKSFVWKEKLDECRETFVEYRARICFILTGKTSEAILSVQKEIKEQKALLQSIVTHFHIVDDPELAAQVGTRVSKDNLNEILHDDSRLKDLVTIIERAQVNILPRESREDYIARVAADIKIDVQKDIQDILQENMSQFIAVFNLFSSQVSLSYEVGFIK